MSVRFCETVVMVKDFNRAKEFYEQLFESEINDKLYKDRWASPIPELSLINPEFDKEKNIPHGLNEVVFGNNVVITLLTDDIEEERKRILEIGATNITQICKINYRTPYYYFHFTDTEGNTIEIGHYPK